MISIKDSSKEEEEENDVEILNDDVDTEFEEVNATLDETSVDVLIQEVENSANKANENITRTPPLEHEEEMPLIERYNCAYEGCRSVEEFECLNRIEEGTYGVVYRAKDKKTNELVALKRLKMEKEREGFPITSLREIDTLLKAQHPNIVTVRVRNNFF
jgi:cell division cycle 2-like protein